MMPERQRSVVVLPAPFGPTNPMTSPARTEKERSLTAGKSPYNFVRPAASIRLGGVDAGCAGGGISMGGG
jgi:hypothetical protein